MSDALMTLADLDTTRLLPESLINDPDAAAILSALDATLRGWVALLPSLSVFATLDDQPSAVIDALAFQWHVDYYDAELPIERRRNLVRQAIPFHRLAGTRDAVEQLINTVWGDTGYTLREWFEVDPPLTPGVFLIILSAPLAEIDVEQFISSIRSVKRATDHPVIMIGSEPVALDVTAYFGAALLQVQHYGTFEV